MDKDMFGAAILGLVAGVIAVTGITMATGTAPRDIIAMRAEAVELGYGTMCVGDNFVWANQSCEMEK